MKTGMVAAFHEPERLKAPPFRTFKVWGVVGRTDALAVHAHSVQVDQTGVLVFHDVVVEDRPIDGVGGSTAPVLVQYTRQAYKQWTSFEEVAEFRTSQIVN